MKITIFTKIVDHLWNLSPQWNDAIYNEATRLLGVYPYIFDYPDYSGLPRSISNRLSPDAVDAIQWALASPPFRRT